MNTINPKIIYSENYNIKFDVPALEAISKIHPFDILKYGKAWERINLLFINNKYKLEKATIIVEKPITEEELKIIHTESYLKRIKYLKYLVDIIELPFLTFIPDINGIHNQIINSILEPMKWGTKGTIIAGKEAIKNGIAINLSGGYHHASKNRGEGFCVYADIAIAIEILRKENIITPNDKIGIIDLDVHQGNGLERIYHDDENVYIFDMYNENIYPQDNWAKKRVNNKFNIPLNSNTSDKEYITKLKNNLPDFFNYAKDLKIVFYIAGTDIYKNDPLGDISVSENGILERDLYILEELIKQKIPCAMVLGGGYTQQSYNLIANSVFEFLNKWGDNLMNNEPNGNDNENANEKKKKKKKGKKGKFLDGIEIVADVAKSIVDTTKEAKRKIEESKRKSEDDDDDTNNSR